MELKIKRIHPAAKLPGYGHPGDAGLDLYAAVDHVLAPASVYAVPTGIKMAIPPGYVGLVWDKSGISLKGGTSVWPASSTPDTAARSRWSWSTWAGSPLPSSRG